MEGNVLTTFRPHIGFTGVHRCHQQILKKIHQKLEKAKVHCRSGAIKALALCPGVQGIQYEFDSKEWIRDFELRSSPGECVEAA